MKPFIMSKFVLWLGTNPSIPAGMLKRREIYINFFHFLKAIYFISFEPLLILMMLSLTRLGHVPA